MSLVGNLEDLGLGEILQIVSLSRKSGVLTLQSQEKEGNIFFSDGQVTRANVSSRRENIGEVLVHRGVADVATVVAAVQSALASGGEKSLGRVLAEEHGVAQESFDGLAKEAVENVVYGFFAWEEGTFSFALGEMAELDEEPFHPLHFVFEQGLNPQWIAMEGSRILDEKRHHGESTDVVDDTPPVPELEALLPSDEEAVEEPPVPEVPEPVEQPVAETPEPVAPVVDSSVPAPLYVVDDDEVTCEVLGKALGAQGVHARFFNDGASFLQVLQQEGTENVVLVVIDLIMPRADGSGILGGLELLESVRQVRPELPVLMVSDHPNPEAEERVRGFGVKELIYKPKKSEVRTPEGVEALGKIAAAVAVGLQSRSAAGATAGAAAPVEAGSDLFNLGEEMRHEFGESDDDFVPARGPQSPGLHLLRGMLAELQNPALGGGIILLVLRFASELMNRAVIFVVKDTEVSGLGQFGIESSQEPADVLVRKMSVPRGAGSIFDQLVDQMTIQRVALGDGEWDNYIRTQLGGGNPEEVFLGPIISEGKVVAILYGDNLPDQSPVGDTESLEIFLSQAGIAMEKALLERRLRVKSDE